MKKLRIIAIACLAVLLQWGFIQELPMSRFGNPYIYLWVFLVLPFNTSKFNNYLYAFVLGSIIDGLEQSGGAHTVASLAMVFAKPYIENVLYGFKDGKSDKGLIHLPLPNFITQTTVLVLLHHTVLYFMENSGVNHTSELVLRTLVSTALTIFLLSIGHLLFSRKYAA